MSCVIAVVLALLATAGWELRVRAMGYGPSINETSDLWALQRSRLDQAGVNAVIVGSSRAQFDLDLESMAAYFGGEKPVQLSMPGTSPMELLESVAQAENFHGTVILGVTPALWFVPAGQPVEQARKAVGRYENWSPSQKVGLRLGIVLQERLAFLNPEDLDLAALLGRIQFPPRAAAASNQPPLLPPYFARVDELRQARMWEKCDFGSPLALEIQSRWIPLFTPPPPPPHMSEEEFRQGFAEFMEGQLGRLATAVETIRARGGRVVFVRPPSTGELRELERRFSPRPAFYDRMLEATGAGGIHFEDHPQLAAFDCPEWSHLEAPDAVAFTKALMPLLIQTLEETDVSH
jgi:hypothetical protein